MPTNSIDIDKIKKAGTSEEVVEVYKRLKRDLIDDPDRQAWEKSRERNWNAAYPLDPEKDGIWTEEEKKQMAEKKQIPVQINDLAKGVQGSSAVVTSKNPGLNFSPIGSGDLYVAELFKLGWDYVLNRNGGPIKFYDWVREAKVGGLGVLEASHDPSKGVYGKIVIKEVDPTTYYYDKKSEERDHSDVSFGKAHQITKKYALETYEELTEDDLIFTEVRKDDEGDKPDTKTGRDNYAIPGDGKAEGPDGPADEEEENIWEIEDWELAKVKELWLMTPDGQGGFSREIFTSRDEIKKSGWEIGKNAEGKEVATRTVFVPMPDQMPVTDPMRMGEEMMRQTIEAFIWPRTVEKRIQRIIVGKKLISKEENPLGVDSDGEPILPIATLPHDKTLKGFPTCPVTRALEISRSRNKRRMQSIYVVSKNLDAPLHRSEATKWVQNKHGEDELVSAKDAAYAPTRVLPGTTSAELMAMEQRDEMALNDEFDLSDVVKGKIPPGQSNIAGRTVLALQDMVGVLSQPFVLAVESGMERIGKSVAALMVMTWPRSQWIRLIDNDELRTWQPEGQEQVDENGQPINPQPDVIMQKWQDAITRICGDPERGIPPISMIDMDVKVIAGSTQPTNRMAKQGVAMEMVKGGIYDAEAALDYIDDPKKDQIVERMERKRQEELQAIAQGQAVKGRG